MTTVIKNRLILIDEENNIKYNELCKILWKLQNTTRSLCNKITQLCWEWYSFSSDYYVKYNKSPNCKDILEYNNLMTFIYNQLKNNYYQFNSGNYSVILKYITDKFKNELKDYKIGKKSIPSFEQDMPLDLHNRSIKLTKVKDYYEVELSLLSVPYYKEINLNSGRFIFKIRPNDDRQKNALDKCISGEYKIGSSKLIYKKKTDKDSSHWQLNLVYSFEIEKKEKSDKQIIMGIDVGIAKPVYCAILDTNERYYIDGGEIEAFRKQIEERRIRLQNQGKWCGSGRCGHGVKTKLKPTQTLSDKESNFRNTTNDRYSKKIIEFALKNNVTKIHMEELSGISKDDSFLKKWSYYDLQQKIKYKAERAGIEISFINPEFTSQQCNKCGYIDSGNRPKDEKGQSYFECLKCGYKTNADYNAAINIAKSNNFIKDT